MQLKKYLFSLALTLLTGYIVAQPANDAICSATAITVGVSCTNGTNVAATSAGTPATPSCWGSVSNDVWFSFVADATSMTVSLDVSGYTLTDTQVAVYSSSNNTCSGTLTQVGCDDDAGTNCGLCSIASLTGLTVGNTYFIRVDGFGAATGTFCLSAYDSNVPGSSACNAQIIHPNSSACAISAGNMVYNATVPTANYAPIGTNYCGCDNETAQYGTWTTFTATSTGTYTISNQTAGANANPMDYTLFSGSCTSLSCISCTSVGKGGTTTFAITAGTVYYILTTLQSGSTSTPFRTDFCLVNSTACTPPTNNACSSPQIITAGTLYSGSSYCATADSPPLLCAGSTENNTWLSWTVPGTWTGNAYFQLFGQNCTGGDVSSGTQVSIYNAGQTCAASTGCVAVSSTSTDNDINVTWTPTPGSTYIINYDGFGGEVCDYQYQITNTAPIVLPVELLEFQAVKNNSVVDVNWKTQTETNNNYFTVQRSRNSKTFEDIGTVVGAGNSIKVNSYVFNDIRPYLSGISYYRIKQTDFNGKYSFSNISVVNYSDTDPLFTIIPNPTEKSADIVFNCFEDGGIGLLKIMDLNGRVILDKEITCSKGNNVSSIDLSEQPKGMYFVTLRVNEKLHTSKLVKMQ